MIHRICALNKNPKAVYYVKKIRVRNAIENFILPIPELEKMVLKHQFVTLLAFDEQVKEDKMRVT
jgi:hypothetical protein